MLEWSVGGIRVSQKGEWVEVECHSGARMELERNQSVRVKCRWNWSVRVESMDMVAVEC